jgi:hypothetical protein
MEGDITKKEVQTSGGNPPVPEQNNSVHFQALAHNNLEVQVSALIDNVDPFLSPR